MELNTNKCKVLRVSRVFHQQATYQLNNVPLETVNSYKYLGVHITTNLSWAIHTEYVINNANRRLGYLCPNFSSSPSNLKHLLYKTRIRPKLEYATSVWDPCHKT